MLRGCFILLLMCGTLSAQTTAPWWKSTTVYQIYPRSFQDSDGDGIGDLRGIISRLDYIQQLGFETIWISPFYDSPQQDFGYDVRDYRAIAPEYGTMADCEALIRAVHQRRMRIVFDMVMNHTSAQHEWFLASQQNKENPYADWYVWRDGRGKNGKKPPNNWKSMVGGSGWHYAETRKQWYWASFLPFQPDLNYRNPAVKNAMLEVVRFWLGKGVDGFRLDIFNAVYEDAHFRNNPASLRAVPSAENPNGFFQKTTRTQDQPESFLLAKELKSVLDAFGKDEKMTVGEVFGSMETTVKYCGKNADGLGMVFSFETLTRKFKAKTYRDLITHFETHFDAPRIPVWVFSNHDRTRSFTRFGADERIAKLQAVLRFTARGVPYTYYGEEIGMRQGDAPLRKGLDPIAQKLKKYPQILFDLSVEDPNRDNCRTPMQWNAEENGGFTNGNPWLAVNGGFSEVNVKMQENRPESLLESYRALLAVRKASAALQAGTMELLAKDFGGKNVLAFVRKSGKEKVLVCLNFSRKKTVVTLPSGSYKLLYATEREIVVGNAGLQISGLGAAVLSVE